MDVNVYDDINDFDLGEEIEKLKTENRMLDEHIHSLQTDIEKLTATIIKLKENQDNLTKNISSLYLTAKAEIDRKDRMIVDLRTQLDNMYFRRRNVNVNPKRKETEENILDVNMAKRFKQDVDDRSYDRSKSQSRYSSDRYSNRSRSGSRERVNKYVDDRGRRYNDRDRWNDDRDKRINDREKWDDRRSNDREKWDNRDKRGNAAQGSEDKYIDSRYSGYDRRKPFER